jgi:hypothetical protein
MFTNEKYMYFTSPTTGKRFYFRVSNTINIRQNTATEVIVYSTTGENQPNLRLVSTNNTAASKLVDQMIPFLSTPYTETLREVVFDGFELTLA